MSSFPPSYGYPVAGNPYWEYIGSFTFDVDPEEGKVEITVTVIVTTGEEDDYGDGEFVNVWIDWEGDGTFDEDEIVLDQVQMAKAIGFKGALTFSAVVHYPEDKEIEDETWIRAVMGYGEDPGPTDTWKYGSTMTKPIELGETEFSNLKIWFENTNQGSLKSAQTDLDATVVNYTASTVRTHAVLDPYYGIKYGNKFMPFINGTYPYQPNSDWDNGSKWDGINIKYEFYAKWPGQKLEGDIKLVQFTDDDYKVIGPKKLASFKWEKGKLEKKTKITGSLPGSIIKNLKEGDYHLVFIRQNYDTDYPAFQWFEEMVKEREVYIDFQITLQRWPYYVSNPLPVLDPTNKVYKVFNFNRQAHDVGYSFATAGLGTSLAMICSGIVSAPATVLIAAIGLTQGGAIIITGAIGGVVFNLIPVWGANRFGHQPGDVAHFFDWDIQKHTWNGSTYKDDVPLKWHIKSYYRRQVHKGVGYWFEGNPGAYQVMDKGDDESWFYTELADFHSKIRYFRYYPDPNAYLANWVGYGPISPGFNPFKPIDPVNIAPVIYEGIDDYPIDKSFQGQTYQLIVRAEDPEGYALAGNYKWIISKGNYSEVLPYVGAKASWNHPGDGKIYLVRVEVTDIYGAKIMSSYVQLPPPGLKSATASAKSITKNGLQEDGFISDFIYEVVDKDSNEKYDSLAISFSLNTAEIDSTGYTGYYFIRACLSDANDVIFSKTGVLFSGLDEPQTLRINFEGKSISKQGVDGVFHIKNFLVEKFTETGIEQIAKDFSIFETSAYRADDFESNHIQISNVPAIAAQDTDNDQLIDYLSVSAEVTVNEPGDYLIIGQLNDKDTLAFLSASNYYSIGTSGMHDLSIEFNGADISRDGKSGPYYLSQLTVMDTSDLSEYDIYHELIKLEYGVEDFERGLISFNSSISDQAMDYNSDGLYDSLEISVGTNIEKAGTYSLLADLIDNETNVIDNVSQIINLSSGTQDIKISFSGRAIYENQKDGPYKLSHLSLMHEDLEASYLPQVYQTNEYNYLDFQKPHLSLTGNYQEDTNDVDSNGEYEVLSIGVEVEVISSGDYELTGSLFDSQGEIVATAYSNRTLTKGNHTINLDFDGQVIMLSGINGPYQLALQGWEGENLIFVGSDLYTTNSYTTSQFQPPAAYFTYIFNESVNDDDEDGYYDFLKINVEVYVSESGDYLIRGELLDTLGNIITETETLKNLNSGNQSVSLAFDGMEIFRKGVNGHYILSKTYLYQVEEEDWKNIDFIDLAYVTDEYVAFDFQRTEAWLANTYSDQGIDLNENGLYDFLNIGVGVEVSVTGYYRVVGQLYDKNGYYIDIYDYIPYFEVGLQEAILEFEGGRIRGHEDASPYVLKYVRVFNESNELLSSQDQAYSTSEYDYEDFEITPPDLLLFASDVLISGGFPGDNMYVLSSTIYNFGGTKADTVELTYYGNELLLASETIYQKVSGGQPAETSFEWNISGLSGTYDLEIAVDPNEKISEINESNNNIAFSLSIPIMNFPSPPENIITSIGADYVELSWEASLLGASGYNIYGKQHPDSTYRKINTSLIEATIFRDTGLYESTSYYYTITAVRTGIPSLEGFYSDELEISTEAVVLHINHADLSANPGGEFLFPIELDDLKDKEIFSARIKLAYNPDVLQAIEVSKDGTITQAWETLEYTIYPEGEVWIDISGVNALHEAGTLIYILFNVVGDANDTTHLRFREFILNDGYPGISAKEIIFTVKNVTAIRKISIDEIESTSLKQNYPNPFRNTTIIPYAVSRSLSGKKAMLTIYNINMAKVRTLVNEYHITGSYEVAWDGCDDHGNKLPEGIYFYHFRIDSVMKVKKLVLMK